MNIHPSTRRSQFDNSCAGWFPIDRNDLEVRAGAAAKIKHPIKGKFSVESEFMKILIMLN